MLGVDASEHSERAFDCKYERIFLMSLKPLSGDANYGKN